MQELLDVDLASRTTIGVGGRARRLLKIETVPDLICALREAFSGQDQIFILGGGSNVIISDHGLDATVIELGGQRIAIHGNMLWTEAGACWDTVVKSSIDANLQGIECLSGIPGRAGATVIQNVGAYGQQVSDSLRVVRAIDRLTQKTVEIYASQCELGYRTSAFKTKWRQRYVIVNLLLELKAIPVAPSILIREDIRDELDGRMPTIGEIRRAVLRLREKKGMIADNPATFEKSAGSFFLNPMITTAKLARIKPLLIKPQRRSTIKKLSIDAARLGQCRIPAAWLIEGVGFAPGYCHPGGRVGLSSNHVQAIVNRKNARAADVVELAEKIQREVDHRFGILLSPEPEFIGLPKPGFIT